MTKKSDKENIHVLMTVWHARATESANAHYFAADWFRKRKIRWTIANIISAIGVLFFANFNYFITLKFPGFTNSVFSQIMDLIIGLAGMAIVITTVVQYFYRFSETENSHKFCANEYSNVKRKIERLKMSKAIDEEAAHRMSNTLNWLSKTSPLISRELFKKSRDKDSEGAFRENKVSSLEVAEIKLAKLFEGFDGL